MELSAHRAFSQRTRWTRRRRLAVPFALLIPALGLMILIVAYPIVRSVYLSFHEFSLLNPSNIGFVGLAKYRHALRDPLFWKALHTTAVWVAAIVPSQLVLGLIVAILLNREFPFRGLVRALVLIPWVFPGVLNALMWTWMYDGNYGVINDLLVRFHVLTQYYPFLAKPGTALPAVIIATVWQGTPFFTIMLLAALQAVSEDLYEAAKIDGASSWQEFRYITIPGILPTIVITALLRTIWVANYTDVILIMTRGGPGYATQTLPVFTFLQAYASLDFGYAAALSFFLAVLLMIVVFLYVLYLRRAGMVLR